MSRLALVSAFAASFLCGPVGSQSVHEGPATAPEPDYFSQLAWRKRDGWGQWISSTEFNLAIDRARPLGDDRFERYYRVTKTAQGEPTQEITSRNCPAVWTVLQSAAALASDLQVSVPAVREPEQATGSGVAAHTPIYDLWLTALIGHGTGARMRLTANTGPLTQLIEESETTLDPCWKAAGPSH